MIGKAAGGRPSYRRRFVRRIAARAGALIVAVALAMSIPGPAAPASESEPAITSFSPTSGPVGTAVTINGTRFAGVTAVRFHDTSASFSVASATQIMAAVPPGATTGRITVETRDDEAESEQSFTVTSATPTITSFTPTSGVVGTQVTINGTNLTGATAVKFHGKTAAYSVNSATQITAIVPAGAKTGTITVTTPNGTATSPGRFTVTRTAPTITSFTPTSGPVGAQVVILGTNFTGATVVKFHGTAALFSVNSATQITAFVPAGATTGKITVTTPNGTATSSGEFNIPVPTITSFTPTSGPAGAQVTITGTNFTGTTAVKFHGTAALFSVSSATQITATVPAGATTGAVTVTAPNGTATSSGQFMVTIPAPAITSFSPTSGPFGAQITITGTNFTGATVVKFHGTAATFSLSSATHITATVPVGTTTGTITVTSPGGTATSPGAFVVVHPRTVTVQGRRGARPVLLGQVLAADGSATCGENVPVQIQRQAAGGWHTVATALTGSAGFWRQRVRGRPGPYRAVAVAVTLPTGDVCAEATSRTLILR